DERAQALVLAEVAAGAFVARGLVLNSARGLEADEGGLAAVVEKPSGFQRSPDGAGFAAMLVHDDVRLHVLALEARLDEIHLCFHRSEVVLRAALQQETAADGGEVGNLRNVQPDILGQHVAQAGHDLFRLPSLALEIDNVGLHEYGATVTERRESLGAEGRVRIVLDRHVETLRGGLQEVAIAGRTLRVEFEILHTAVLQDDDLDVLAAHVADHVHVVVEMQAGFGVRHRLDQSRIRADHVLENVLGVAGGADAQNLQLGALVENLPIEFFEHLDGVFDRVAFGKLVGFCQNAALVVLGDQHRFGGRRSAVDADETFHHFARLKSRRHEFLVPVFALERVQLGVILGQAACATALGFLLVAAYLDIPRQLVPAGVLADALVLRFTELDRADGGEVLRVVRRLDQVFRRNAFGERRAALLPDFRDVVLPTIAHALDVTVRAAEQQHHGLQRVAARQHGEVLHHDGFEQRSHQLIGRHTHLLQAVDIGLGEHTALAGHGMQLDAAVAHLAKLLGGDAQLGVDLVDDRAGAAGAFVVHRRNLLLAAGLRIFFEDDNLGVLPAQFDHRTALGIEPLDGERNRVDLLQKLGAQLIAQSVAARAGNKDARFGGVEAIDLTIEPAAEFEHLLGLLGVVTLIVLPEYP